ncbi:MAG: N-acetylglucosamine-6-phosphate deacetylase [Acidobacteriota bacterium]|nr:N-acetylglucosamine-6-phosphate deacetylase [Acidobacteriota bacterium]
MPEPVQKPFVFRNARIVLPEQVMDGGAMTVAEGRIASISHKSPGNVRGDNLDLRGLTVYPGFIDVHIHGAVGVDTMEATASDLDRVSQFLVTRGVTGWLPTLVPAPNEDYERAVKAIDYAMKSHRGARILGAHYEGPFVNSAQCGALRSRYFRSFSSVNDIADLPVFEYKAAKHMMTVAPEIDGGVELVRELKRRGWIVSIGHTRASFELLDNALEAGARHMTHFMNAMAPLHHRSPGPVAWGLAHDEVTCDIIADGIHLDRQMLQLLLKLKSVNRLTLISDAVAPAGMADGDYRIWGETITVKDGRTSNPSGSIAGSVITMHDAFIMMQSMGVSEVDLSRLSATNPARLLGIEQDCGSIEEGKRADLVALDSQGKVVLSIIGGEIVFDARS